MTERWWVINEDELIEALKRVHFGDPWPTVMNELLAKSVNENVE